MTVLRSVEAWGNKCRKEQHYLIGTYVGQDWPICLACVRAYAAEQVAQARKKDVQWWLDVIKDHFAAVRARK